MQGKKFTDEFKIEAVKQITERGASVRDVSARLGVSTYSLYQWRKAHTVPPEQRQEQAELASKVRRLEAELRRVTDERDILKKAAAYFAKQSG
jgi:transposase